MRLTLSILFGAGLLFSCFGAPPTGTLFKDVPQVTEAAPADRFLILTGPDQSLSRTITKSNLEAGWAGGSSGGITELRAMELAREEMLAGNPIVGVLQNAANTRYLTNDANGFAVDAAPVSGVRFHVGGALGFNYLAQQAVTENAIKRTTITGHSTAYTSGNPLFTVFPTTGQTVPAFRVSATNGTHAFTVREDGGIFASGKVWATNGFTTPGDVNAGSMTLNGSTITTWPGGGGGITEAQAAAHLGVINVKDYGATGNGTTDDTAAIQAAIDTYSATRPTFYFPKGNYRLTAPIKIRRENASLIGDGPHRTRFTQTGANQHGIVIEPSAGNHGGAGAMWQTKLEGFQVVGPGRNNTTAAAIYVGSLTDPGAYFADMMKLYRIRIGEEGNTISGFKYGLSVSNAVSVDAELCQFWVCNEAVRLAKCDSAYFVECQTGYTGAWEPAARDDPNTVNFNIFGGGLGTHIVGGEHGHLYRFANIAPASIVTVLGGNYESFGGPERFLINNAHVTVINPTMSAGAGTVPIYRITSGADKVTVIQGHYGTSQNIFAMTTVNDIPNWIGPPVTALNHAGAAFTLDPRYPLLKGLSITNHATLPAVTVQGQVQIRNANRGLQLGGDYINSMASNTITANTTKYAGIYTPAYSSTDYNRVLLEWEDWDGTGSNLKLGADTVLGYSGPMYTYFYTTPTIAGAPVRRWQLQPTGDFLPSTTHPLSSFGGAYNWPSTSWVSNSFAKYFVATNALILMTNSPVVVPTAPRTRGEAWMWNSNGVVYLLSSGPHSLTWDRTNEVATLGARHATTSDSAFNMLQAYRTRELSANLTLSDPTAVSATETRYSVWVLKATGANRTVTLPAAWRTPDGLGVYTVTNNAYGVLSVTTVGTFVTNAAYAPFWRQ
jgi:hypothetical protein